jgi:hypothetical protein
MPDELLNRVMALPRESAIEAARFVAAEVTGDVPDQQVEQAGAWVSKQPFAHVGDVEALARILLCAQALSGAEEAARVERAIAGSGRQNLVLGGLEIVALAGLGVIALQVVLTGGKLVTEEVTYGEDADGRRTVTVRRVEKPLVLSDSLAAIVKPLFTPPG